MDDYGCARKGAYTQSEIGRIEAHNERTKESYTNGDIYLERSKENVHFKLCQDTYLRTLEKLIGDGTVSKRGLGKNPILFNEVVFDVNSDYFERNGGYEFAVEFYRKAYQYAVALAGGAQYILSAVLHADERNAALSEEYGHDVWHYHLHVVFVPVVQKEIRYSKRCKNEELVGTVKETVMQISDSKKWASRPIRDASGKTQRDKDGKIMYDYSYAALQTEFTQHMQTNGYPDVLRGIAGSKREHLETTEYKRQQDKKRAQEAALQADRLTARVEEKAAQLQQIEHQIVVGQAAVEEERAALSQIQDDATYFNFADRCREILQGIFARLSAFLARKGHFRDRDAERSLCEDIRTGIVSLLEKLKQLSGYEYRENIAPEDCESYCIVAELPALDAQIGAAMAAPKAYQPSSSQYALELR